MTSPVSKLSSRTQDVALAGVATAFGLISLVTDLAKNDSAASTASFVMVAVAGLFLVLRRWNPVVVMVAVAALRVAVVADSGNDLALTLAAVIALYTVAQTGDRRTHVAIAVAVAVAMTLPVASFSDDAFVPEALGELAILLLPVALGDAARSRAERVRDLIDTEADRRVADERLRIARDLHDVVAHGLSTIAVQSGVAAHLLDRDPDQAKQALEIINQTGKSSLEELRAMVGVLRSTDDAPLRPTPTDPNDLSDLVAGAARLGIMVTVTATGAFPRDVGDSCVVALHRIVQEALTNVARHAGPTASELRIDHRDSHVDVSIINAAGSGPDDDLPSTGVGIVGMTERAEALGGSLTTRSLPEGGFEVVARIPYHHRRSQKDPA